jgi:hypothetical protein
MLSFGADNLSLTLNEVGDSYTIKSTVNSGAQVGTAGPESVTHGAPWVLGVSSEV